MVKSVAHWGNSQITGRGLLALAGRGSIAQIALQNEETYIAHPRFVTASDEGSRAHLSVVVTSLPTQ